MGSYEFMLEFIEGQLALAKDMESEMPDWARKYVLSALSSYKDSLIMIGNLYAENQRYLERIKELTDQCNEVYAKLKKAEGGGS